MPGQGLVFAGRTASLGDMKRGSAQVEDISVKRALAMPVLLLALMMSSAALVSLYTGVDGSRVFWPYVSGWATATLVSVLIWMMVETILMAMRKDGDPIRRLACKLLSKSPMIPNSGAHISAVRRQLHLGQSVNSLRRRLPLGSILGRP